jgi:hypothetical protein
MGADDVTDSLDTIKVPDFKAYTNEDCLDLHAGVDTYHFRASIWKEELVDMENLFGLDIWVEEQLR